MGEDQKQEMSLLLDKQDERLQYDQQRQQQQQQQTREEPEIRIKIVSATYGPCEGLRLPTGELTDDKATSIPLSRDVAPFLRALLIVGQLHEQQRRIIEQQQQQPTTFDSTAKTTTTDGINEAIPHIVRVNPTAEGQSKVWIHVLGGGGKSMNAVFGDPCPGTSKRLDVHYIVTEALPGDDAETRAAKTEVHHVSFAEHDMVVFRRRLTFFQDDVQLQAAVERAAKKMKLLHSTETSDENNLKSSVGDDSNEVKSTITENERPIDMSNTDDETLQQAKKMGRSQSILEIAAMSVENSLSVGNNNQQLEVQAEYSKEHDADSENFPSPSKKWRLRSAVSEIVLPLVLPFLEVQERVQCRLICRSWKHVIRDWGVATTIDSNDRNISNFSRHFLRGILSHSYSSLQSLFLSGFESLQKEDLHPAIPHLRKLRTFDVTRCHDLDDSTMVLLSQHVHRTLEVLYIKGLRQVSDVGVKAVCDSCTKLEVLEISHVPITDEGGLAIAKLIKLRALFMRDNYYLTNASIDVITGNCKRLAQLTLWGCTRIRHLRFDSVHHVAFSSGKLVILNLWGCYGLTDEAAESLGNMKNLSSLIVSECHRLSDCFIETLAKTVPNLNHLHLRYCKRLTDNSIHIIAKTMRHLYSLDLTFCSRVTAAALSTLLEARHDCLAELRLKSCKNLNISQQSENNHRSAMQRRGGGGGGFDRNARRNDGQLILKAIKSLPTHCLCVLDLRDCGGQPSPTDPYPEDDPFVIGMKELHFEQRVPGFFSRPSRWSSVQRHLVEQQIILQETPLISR